MKQDFGFTLLELITVVAIFAVVSAVAIPNLIQWKKNAAFRGSVSTLQGDLASAKKTAITLNSQVAIRFAGNSYTIFVDDGAGTTDSDGDGIMDGYCNGYRDGTETIVQQREIPSDVVISDITFPSNFTVFNGKGLCPSANVGSIVFSDNSRTRKTVSINRLGRIKNS